MTTLVSLIAALVLIAGAVTSELLSWTDKLAKHEHLKKFAEAKALRAVLFFVSIGLLAAVLRDVTVIRESLNAPPPKQKPPAQVNLQDLACTTIQISKPARVSSSGISGTKISGHDYAVAGSINQQGRNNIAQNGSNNSATINDAPPERRIKPEDSASMIPLLATNPTRVNVLAPLGDNEAQQLGVDIYNTLKAAGWTMENKIVLSFEKIGGPVERGVMIFSHGEPVTHTTTVQLANGDPLLLLQSFFRKADIEFAASRNMESAEGVITIQVGPAPKAPK